MPRRVAVAILLLSAPSVLALGLGWWNPPAAWIEARVLGLLGILSGPVDAVPLLFTEWRALGPILAAGLGVGWLAANEHRVPGGRYPVAGVESVLASAGLLAGCGLLAVGVGIDRPLFWAGVLAALGGRGAALSSSGAGARAGAATAAVALAWLAGTTLLEGPGMHSPAFWARELWLDSPLGTPAGAALAWGLPGLLLLRWRRPRALALVAMAAYTLAVLLRAPSVGRAVSELGSGLGLIAAASVLGPTVLALAPRARGWACFEPRHAFAAAGPILLWTVVCASRGFTVFLWTAPGDLPPGVERLDDRRDVFSVAVDGDYVLYTDREGDKLVRQGANGFSEWTVWDPGGVGLEEVGGPFDGGAWVSVAGDDAGALLRVDYIGGQGTLVNVDGCWISAWQPLPAAAIDALGGEAGDVLVGCESAPFAWVLRTSEQRRVHVLMLDHEVEEVAFAADGRSFWTVGLWTGDSIQRVGWPGGEPLGGRLIGGFNWTLVPDPARGQVYVGRFFEGTVLALDADTLAVERRLPFRFGLRALLLEPVHDLLWGAAAYSGLVIARPAGGGPARSWALCGQARDLAADDRGRVIVATDCGVFRIDPGAW